MLAQPPIRTSRNALEGGGNACAHVGFVDDALFCERLSDSEHALQGRIGGVVGRANDAPEFFGFFHNSSLSVGRHNLTEADAGGESIAPGGGAL